ncbi:MULTISPECIES: tripartite tricarboxylate transporter substrate binding protein [unclassified Bradyrhizobium]|uniref:Bug family tripartite tricarboxylate transporter substrate binding protein n=1 Tax=unclassified Bradyrhizobium TaxID=2631580 RepID=UPI00247A0F8C|nr:MULTISPECIES: tripartite tricarboxylate transporter substrate binding protein [unclassified Bradyrhizobium]WGR69803.1 tripartite tricarboxylate transporter substrate binding protein [Bradyrhizobium sp. ISRA426]WGR81859.1 tripartite tricarboxylate transporter substrate binding protein [Bradyrhizobium sp. ISRA430]WGR85045.1 tripartite tricarboxylate transporter substrate binding protein [Bradyrhizobium sp. ISRA432]
MSIFSRSAAVISILLGAIFSWSSAVIAADWPHRTVRLILPVPAGAAADFTARLFAERLSQRWGQPVIVENRPGADGIVGVSAFLGTDDDHTLLYAISAVFTVHPITQQKLPYDPVRDLVPISPTSDVVLAIAASEKSSIRSLDDLVRTARAQPGKLNWAASPGLPPFIAGGFFKRSKLDLAFVSYRDIGPALQDLGEGRIDVFVHALGVIMSQVQSGRARLLAVASDVRVPIAPDVPTVTEAGFPELRMDGVVGFYGKRGMPDTLRDRIASDVRAVASDPGVGERLAAVGQTARPGTAAEFAGLLDQYRRRLADLAKTIDFEAPQ